MKLATAGSASGLANSDSTSVSITITPVDPDSSQVVYGQPVELAAKAGFSAPGTYVLRATAFDGQLYTTRDVTVTATPKAGP